MIGPVDPLAQLGLQRRPFPPTPDAQCYFHTPALERELGEVMHCVASRKGFVLVTGEVGTGKSTFLRRLLDTLEADDVKASLVFNTFLQGSALLAAVLRDFGVEPKEDIGADIDALNRFLLRQWNLGKTCVLVIDDAQNLGIESLELLRLLSNLESGQEKLLQVVLCGQPELLDVLARDEIRQLTTRIVRHVRLQSLDAAETARYVDFRLSMSGAGGRIVLDAAARRVLFEDSQGNPRRIHLIMDRCLYGVLGSTHGSVDERLVRAAAAEAGVGGRRRRDRAAWRPAAAVAASIAVAAALSFGLFAALRSRAVAKPLPVAAAKPATAVTDAWSACVRELGRSEGAPVHLVRVPETWLDAGRTAGRCAGRPDGHATIAWRPVVRPEQFATGERDPAVAALQAELARRGLYDGVVDSRFGPRTRDALAHFQSSLGLEARGVPDDLTLLKLALAPRPPGAAALSDTRNP
jgi:general secretion pathway protein A